MSNIGLPEALVVAAVGLTVIVGPILLIVWLVRTVRRERRENRAWVEKRQG